MTIARITIILVLGLLGLHARPARAQSAEAETLFREGKKLLKQGDIAGACDKFEASERLESSAGTELNLADCREKNGQLASAWVMFKKAASTAKHSDADGKRAAEAKRRAGELESRLVHLSVAIADDHRVAGMTVKRNGLELDPELWNQAVPVDPGRYEIEVAAPGYKTWHTTIAVKAKDKEIEVPELAKRRGGDEPAATTPEPRTRPTAGMTGARKASIGLAVFGVVALGSAVGLGLHAQDLESQSDALCGVPCRDPSGVDLNQRARDYGLVANIGFAAGGAAIVGAAVLWFVGGPKAVESVAVMPARDGVAFAVRGRF